MKSIFVVPILLCLAVAEPPSDPEATPRFPHIDEMLQRGSECSESDIQRCFREYGRDAIPYLLERFKHEDNPHVKGKVAFCLGGFRAVEATPQIIDFVKGQLKGKMTEDQRTGAIGALFGLGSIGTRESLAFLKSLVNMTYWNQVQSPPSGPEEQDNVQRTETQFREIALSSISIAGNAESLKVLIGLLLEVERPFWGRVRGVVQEDWRRISGIPPERQAVP